jgi:hypothetical protein
MNKKTICFLLLSLILTMFLSDNQTFGQKNDLKSKRMKKSDDRNIEQNIMFSRIDSLVNCHQFVFQSEYITSPDLVFVVVDSSYGAVQNGIRNNLQGRITKYEVSKNEKKKTLSVTIKMRGEIYSADIFLFIGEYGTGKATIKSDTPGYFSFDGKLVNIENATINEWPSHFVH